MKYTNSMLAFQLFIILGFSSYCCRSSFSRQIDVLKVYFNATGSDVGDSGHLFIDILKNCQNESEKKIFQSQIVSFYFKLFEKYGGPENVQKSMAILKENIIQKFFNRDSDWEAFQNLIRISVEDVDVQRRAIIELSRVMDDLSPSLRKRRRSQMPWDRKVSK